MRQRVLSAIVGIALFLFFCFSNPILMLCGVVLVALLCAYEWTTAYSNRLVPELLSPTANALQASLPFLGALYPVGLYLRLSRGDIPPLYPSILVALPIPVFALLTLRAARTGIALGSLRRFYGLVGAVYIALPISSLVILRNFFTIPSAKPPIAHTPLGAWLVLFTAACVWAADSLAFFVGRRFGRHKLAPTLSPGKTWEGVLGGLLGALMGGALVARCLGLPFWDGVILGTTAGIVGPWGDLWESALKRELGLKDFGRLLPGHGGFLDRFDSLLFVLPLACLFWALLS